MQGMPFRHSSLLNSNIHKNEVVPGLAVNRYYCFKTYIYASSDKRKLNDSYKMVGSDWFGVAFLLF